MKDIVIRGKDLRRELVIFLLCLAVAVGIDAVAVAVYHRPFTEIFITIGYELSIAVALYAVQLAVRFIIYLLKSVFCGGK